MWALDDVESAGKTINHDINGDVVVRHRLDGGVHEGLVEVEYERLAFEVGRRGDVLVKF